MTVVDVQKLESNPSASVIHEVLSGLDKRDDHLSLVEILSIIKTVAPVYPSLRHETMDVLVKLISADFSFIAQLTSFTSALEEKQAERRIYKALIADVVRKKYRWLLSYMNQCSCRRIQGNEVKALLFGSKLFNVISTEMDVIEYLRHLADQWRFALAEMTKEDLRRRGTQVAEFLMAMFTLHPVLSRDIIIEELFLATTDSFQSLKVIIDSSTPLNRQKLMKNLVFPYLDMHASSDNYQSIYSILKGLTVECCTDAFYMLRLNRWILMECAVRLLSAESSAQLLGALIQMFARADPALDEKVCQLIIIVLNHAPDAQLKWKIGTDSKFLDGVTSRLMQKDRLVRERTMFIAKSVSNNELKYESDFEIKVPDLQLPDDHSAIDFGNLKRASTSSYNDSTNSSLSINRNEIASLSIDSDDDDYGDDDMDREIVFLKDLVIEFASLDNKKRTSPVSLLKRTIKLIRQKKDFPSEVSYYSTGLLSSVACLNNDLDESHFEEARINALVSILVTTPNKVTELLRIFFTSELSLQQKMSLLSSVGLSARELRGHDDKSIVKPKYDFPTSRLPWDKPAAALTENIQKAYDQDVSLEKVVWKSKKLQSDKQAVTKENNFRQYAGLFFYPLVHAWLDGIDLGTFDELFKSHYLMTLHIVYSCAYPVHDYDVMTDLMNEVAASANRQGIKI